MAQRKRKHAAVEQQQTSISSFAKVTKANTDDGCGKKRKIAYPCKQTTDPAPVLAPTSTNKRKRNREEDDSTIEVKSQPKSTSKPDALPAQPSTPRSKRMRNDAPTAPETPSRAAMALFDKLDINLKNVTKPAELPEELLQMRDLYVAFLAAVSLYYSHNGTASPINVKALLPMITSHWKKREATMSDLQQLLAIERRADAAFTIEDYGRAGVCLSRIPFAATTRGRAPTRTATFLDAPELTASFDAALHSLWHDWTLRPSSSAADLSAAACLAALPIPPIALNASARAAAPLFARGQQRLADIKATAAAAAAQTPSNSKFSTANSSSPTPATLAPAPQLRRSALLDRVLAKQSLLASQPAGPTAEQRARTAALQRCPDVARVLLTLLPSRTGRATFSLPALAQRVQQSLPPGAALSPAEAERCLVTLAEEVAPGFVRVVRTGAVAAVVLSGGAAVDVGEVRRRVAGLL